MRAKEIFDRLDVDGDGEITMSEFVEGYLRLMKWSLLQGGNSSVYGLLKVYDGA